MIRRLLQSIAVFFFVLTQCLLLPVRALPLLAKPWRAFIVPHFRIKLMQDTAMFCENIGVCKFYKFIRFLYKVGAATQELNEGSRNLDDGSRDLNATTTTARDVAPGMWVDLGEGVTGWIYRTEPEVKKGVVVYNEVSEDREICVDNHDGEDGEMTRKGSTNHSEKGNGSTTKGGVINDDIGNCTLISGDTASNGIIYHNGGRDTGEITNGISEDEAKNEALMKSPNGQQSKTNDLKKSKLNGTFLTPTEDLKTKKNHPKAKTGHPKQGRAVYVILHGGGFIYGSPTLISHFSQRLSSALGDDVIALNYPLAPEHTYPTQVEYVVRAIRKIRQKNKGKEKSGEEDENKDMDKKEDKGKEEEIAGSTFLHVVGVSAGANLALASCLVMRDLNDGALPDSLTLIGGPYSASSNSRSYAEYENGPKLTKSMLNQYWSLYTKGDMSMCPNVDMGKPEIRLDDDELLKSLNDLRFTDPQRSAYVTPLESNSFTGLPKTLINVAEHDILRSDSVALYRKMKNDRCDVSIRVFPGAHIHLAGASGWAEDAIIRQIKNAVVC